MDLLRHASLIGALVTVGLMAGLYFAYSCSVMPGLRHADDRTFVTTMQTINDAIQNGWFFLVFLGALLFTGVSGLTQLGGGHRATLGWIAAGFVLYGLTIVTTGAVNVPLNNDLSHVGQPGGPTDLAAARAAFETTWVRWNLVRTASATAAFACLTWALVLHSRTRP
ncbi:DUF1772 domain-containing protein [Frankia sp. AgPm24]|uniref:anthrone oxygenase family protein n=1 Tax=Frankia sp. AgPm24 TaxID=631128 RepID=UPI00200F48EC|nr:anthrone oxygenase family protein [Frankia sp. AgPm24]MCK9923865.1 DUF1772 domain-containing protein [Frankia sp. AgPm24]